MELFHSSIYCKTLIFILLVTYELECLQEHFLLLFPWNWISPTQPKENIIGKFVSLTYNRLMSFTYLIKRVVIQQIRSKRYFEAHSIQKINIVKYN